MSGFKPEYRPGAPIPYRAEPQGPKRYGFHPAQYHKAQAHDVYLQYQRQIARDKAETIKKRSERNLDGKLKINNLELVFLTINSRRWFGISQIVSVLFSHRPRSSVVTRMKMLGIEFYCGNYDELRRMKELGGVETHCSRCKLISEQDLVKLLLCFYRFTALPRGKGKISTNGLSTYLDDILREIAMGRVELGKDLHEDGKIDDDTWSQISERMLLKNAEKVETITRGPPPGKKDTFAFDVDNETEFVMPGSPSRYIPRSQRVSRAQSTTSKVKTEEISPKPPYLNVTPPTKTELHTPTNIPSPRSEATLVKEEGESMSLLLPKLIRAERTKKPPRAIWPRWYPPTAEGETGDDNRPTITVKSSPSFPLSGNTIPTIQCLLSHFRATGGKRMQPAPEDISKYMLIDGKEISPSDVKEVKIKRDTGEECIVSLDDLTFRDIRFCEDDIIQIVTRQDLEDQYNKQKSESSSRKNSSEQDPEGGEEKKDEEEKEKEVKEEEKEPPKNKTKRKGRIGKQKPKAKEPAPPKPEPVEYTPEQLQYVQKLKESFDFPYAFPRTKTLKQEPNEYGIYDEETFLTRQRFPPYRRNPIVDNQIFRKLMLQKRSPLLDQDDKDDILGESPLGSTSSFGKLYDEPSPMPDLSSATMNPVNGQVILSPEDANTAKDSVLRPQGSIIKSKVPKYQCQETVERHRDDKTEQSRDRVKSDTAVNEAPVAPRARTASDSAAEKPVGKGGEPVFVLSDESDAVSDSTGNTELRNRPRKRFRRVSSCRERLGSGGSSEYDEETIKPEHVYRFKFKTVSETQDYPYMSAKPTSLLKLVKLDKCNYPVGCRSAPFLFDTRPMDRVLDRGPFVRQYDIEPTSENVWSGVSLWACDDSDNLSDTSSHNGSCQSAPELQKRPVKRSRPPAQLPVRQIASAGNSPVRNKSGKNTSPDMSGLDILSSVAYNADRLRNTPTKRQRGALSRKQQSSGGEETRRPLPTREGRGGKKTVSPMNLQVTHIRVGGKRKTEAKEDDDHNKNRKVDT